MPKLEDDTETAEWERGKLTAHARGTVIRPTPADGAQHGKWIECSACKGEEGESVTTGAWQECSQCEGTGGYRG